jgi:hypothetical protein
MKIQQALGALAIVTIALVGVACQKEPETTSVAATPSAEAPADQATAPAVAPPVEAAPVITKDSPIWFEPEAISECAKDEKAMVHWNAGGFPGVVTVKVAIVTKPDEETVFAVTGVVNQKETGPWIRGGTEFVLRDNANGTELARAKVPSIPCQQ